MPLSTLFRRQPRLKLAHPCAGCPQHTNAQTRRHFITQTALAALALTLLPWRRAEAKKVGMQLAQVKALQLVGGAAVVKIKGQDVLLVRDSKTTVKAINPMCTHKKCLVHYKAAQGQLGCQCHKSNFKLDGTVLGGPATRPLQTYPTELRGEQIVISLPDA